MFKFLFAMVIPICIFIYTISFTRWLAGRHQMGASISTALLALAALCTSGATFWKMMM